MCDLLNTVLDENVRSKDAVEIAFFGGTFTSWPSNEQLLCIKTAQELCATCKSVRIRCSTRPDALTPEWLQTLRNIGLNMIELGVQSFDDCALHASQRGYDGAQARAGCTQVREAGLECGVQLLAGMPAHTPDMFLHDVAQALALGACCMRWYPCLVLEGTVLADMWRAGLYTPWDLPTTVQTFGKALCLAWEAAVPVIRMGLAPGPELAAAMVAGPWHPALGSLVQAEALLHLAERHRRPGERLVGLALPAATRGFVGGERGSAWPRWAALGMRPQTIVWHEGPDAILTYEAGDTGVQDRAARP